MRVNLIGAVPVLTQISAGSAALLHQLSFDLTSDSPGFYIKLEPMGKLMPDLVAVSKEMLVIAVFQDALFSRFEFRFRSESIAIGSKDQSTEAQRNKPEVTGGNESKRPRPGLQRIRDPDDRWTGPQLTHC